MILPLHTLILYALKDKNKKFETRKIRNNEKKRQKKLEPGRRCAVTPLTQNRIGGYVLHMWYIVHGHGHRDRHLGVLILQFLFTFFSIKT